MPSEAEVKLSTESSSSSRPSAEDVPVSNSGTRNLRATGAEDVRPDVARWREFARQYGGEFYGPIIEHVTFPETKFFKMMAARDADRAEAERQLAEYRADAERKLAATRQSLYEAWALMDQARDILTNGKPTRDCNWGMLDTSYARVAYSQRGASTKEVDRG